MTERAPEGQCQSVRPCLFGFPKTGPLVCIGGLMRRQRGLQGLFLQVFLRRINRQQDPQMEEFPTCLARTKATAHHPCPETPWKAELGWGSSKARRGGWPKRTLKEEKRHAEAWNASPWPDRLGTTTCEQRLSVRSTPFIGLRARKAKRLERNFQNTVGPFKERLVRAVRLLSGGRCGFLTSARATKSSYPH